MATIAACSGSSKKNDSPAFTAACDDTLTFDANIAPIVATSGKGHCASCHPGVYDTKAGLLANKENVKGEVESSMPKDSTLTTFQESDDYKTMLNWLACSSPK